MSSILHIYSRVSTEGQEEGYSIENQQKLGVEYSKREGFSSYEIHNEGGVSGSGEKIGERKVLTELLDRVKDGEVRDIFVQDISRLSRNSDVSHDILRILRDTKSNLHTSSGKISFSSPEDVLRYNILSSIGEYENNLRRDKIKQGVRSRILEGKSHSYYQNFGYTIDDEGKLIPYEEEKQLYLRMVRMTMDGKSPYEISGILNDEGVLTPRISLYKKRGKKTPTDKVFLWTPQNVDRIMKSEFYKGDRYYFGKEKKEKVKVSVPPLLTEEEWSLLQTTIEKRVKSGRKKKRHNPDNLYLLKGLCRCRKCGGFMWGKVRKETNGKVTENTYYCSRKNGRVKREKGGCSLRSINRVMLEEVVWERLIDTLSNSNTRKEEVKRKILGEDEGERKLIVETLRKEVSSLTYQLKTNEDKLKNLTRQLIEERVDEKLFDEMKGEIDKDNEEKKTSLLDKQHHLSLIENDKEWVSWLSSFEEEMEGLRNLTTTEERQPTIDKYVSELWIDYQDDTKTHDVFIYLRFPIVDDSFSWKMNENNELELDERGRRVGVVEEGGNRVDVTGLRNHKQKNTYKSRNGFVCGIMTSPSGKTFSYLWEIHLQLTIPCIRKTNGRFGYYKGKVKSSRMKFSIEEETL